MITMLPEPLKSLDELVLKQYTKLSEKVKKQDESEKYVLASMFNMGAKAFLFGTFITSVLNGDYAFSGLALSIGLTNSFEMFFYNNKANQAEYYQTHHRVKDKFVEKAKSVYNYVRLPTFMAGASLTGVGIANLYNYVVNKDSSSFAAASDCFLLGMGMLGWSSAMYLRDSDPKLLDKQEVYYEELVPVPVRVKNRRR